MSLPASPLHGVSAIIANSKGKLLVGRRLASHGAGSWQLPGGHLEENEGLLACTAREVAEETGLQVQPTRVVDTTYDLFSDKGKHYITWNVLCDLKDADARPENMEPEKCSGWEWKTLDELRSLTLFLPLRQLLSRYSTLSDIITDGRGPIIELPQRRGGLNIKWRTDDSQDSSYQLRSEQLTLPPLGDFSIIDASPLDVSGGCFTVLVCGPDGRDQEWPLGRDIALLDDDGKQIKTFLELFPEVKSEGGHAVM
ncbi:hypothetical protein CP533_4353 [Ophiocordyceps camponoti-saundersi (nom. inval.)]|nr:hypothetical protein CP533_4353 [Ophiocordyceps camponoti-saundersi (nom. inval.)]